jgi:putative transcriptional regulator
VIKTVRWSDEDEAFVGTVHGLVGDCCHGADPVEVFRECEEIAVECVEAALAMNKKLPASRLDREAEPVPSASAIRGLLGMSQREFAEFLNISPKTLHKWEQGSSQPSGAARTLLRLTAINPKMVRKAARV